MTDGAAGPTQSRLAARALISNKRAGRKQPRGVRHFALKTEKIDTNPIPVRKREHSLFMTQPPVHTLPSRDQRVTPPDHQACWFLRCQRVWWPCSLGGASPRTPRFSLKADSILRETEASEKAACQEESSPASYLFNISIDQATALCRCDDRGPGDSRDSPQGSCDWCAFVLTAEVTGTATPQPRSPAAGGMGQSPRFLLLHRRSSWTRPVVAPQSLGVEVQCVPGAGEASCIYF